MSSRSGSVQVGGGPGRVELLEEELAALLLVGLAASFVYAALRLPKEDF